MIGSYNYHWAGPAGALKTDINKSEDNIVVSES